jgi:hypothetical protein
MNRAGHAIGDRVFQASRGLERHIGLIGIGTMAA